MTPDSKRFARGRADADSCSARRQRGRALRLCRHNRIAVQLRRALLLGENSTAMADAELRAYWCNLAWHMERPARGRNQPFLPAFRPFTTDHVRCVTARPSPPAPLWCVRRVHVGPPWTRAGVSGGGCCRRPPSTTAMIVTFPPESHRQRIAPSVSYRLIGFRVR